MKKILLMFMVLISLAGCASQSPFEQSKGGPTMKENYENHLLGGGSSGDGTNESRLNGVGTIERNLENDINYRGVGENRYGRLTNPELEMYIYPHRSGKHGVIIPGYSVRFPMYERVQYGLVRGGVGGQ